ncbi:hypothetical protein Mp_3g09160 [Marchantia polymorpha subsp. ruderalis]|uniref:Uncharacterized protein n=2 Tax=Marchantia polymorpha TaxID=3197 RepID=A0AAF6AYY5_MARPO|nr:hypothetical protein MARPO_0105s0001 [Marchantia polymorpha]BBN04969.1 hypothetical protein Mp_3g09160 [Marchantia polymorpha subsp. ruderalis]|eukprot:PTQ31874.1 hypothetical protein MARPO_0105s0001 [Marchantia polymorpha]
MIRNHQSNSEKSLGQCEHSHSCLTQSALVLKWPSTLGELRRWNTSDNGKESLCTRDESLCTRDDGHRFSTKPARSKDLSHQNFISRCPEAALTWRKCIHCVRLTWNWLCCLLSCKRCHQLWSRAVASGGDDAVKQAVDRNKNCKAFLVLLEGLAPLVQFLCDSSKKGQGQNKSTPVTEWLEKLRSRLEEAEALVRECISQGSRPWNIVKNRSTSKKLVEVTRGITDLVGQAPLVQLGYTKETTDEVKKILEVACETGHELM